MGIINDPGEQENVTTEEYNGPLHANSAMLRKLDELLPIFTELNRYLEELEMALKNGALRWRKPA